MGRKGRLWSTLLIAACSCSIPELTQERGNVELIFSCPDIMSKTADPDEKLLSELTVLIYNDEGLLEDKRQFSKAELSEGGSISHETSLIIGKEYSFYACANIGQEIHASTVEQLRQLKCHLAYPDEYREGIPMAGYIEGRKIVKGDNQIELSLKRMMAKISLKVDRGGLADDVSMKVISARIGNCPKSALLFADNRVGSRDDCFATGFTRDENECNILNRTISNGMSGSLSFYMLENIQEDFDRDEGPQEICSYIELHIDYDSPDRYTGSTPLIYRFNIGEDEYSAEVERNCHYSITVIPEDDGLSLNSWKVDKSGLLEKDSNVFFEMIPSGHIQGYVGDEVHVRCDYSPEDADFDIGLEELEYDKERGIYDYRIDEDGKGVTLRLKSPGMGIIYMTAGEPINEAGLLVIEVNE